MDKLSGISEVVLVRKDKRIYRWASVSQEMWKLLKPFDILSLQTQLLKLPTDRLNRAQQ